MLRIQKLSAIFLTIILTECGAAVNRERAKDEPSPITRIKGATVVLVNGAFYFRRMENTFADVA